MGLNDLSPEDDSTENSQSGGRRRYVQPTKEEFEKCLAQTEHEWEINYNAPGNEYVYETHEFMPEHNGIVLRIFSTIDQKNDRARSKGSDAIRLVIWNNHLVKPMGGRKKTLRIETYCKNLLEKIEDIFASHEDYVVECDNCGAWMVIRDGQYGEFYGCSNYPDCKNTKEIE